MFILRYRGEGRSPGWPTRRSSVLRRARRIRTRKALLASDAFAALRTTFTRRGQPYTQCQYQPSTMALAAAAAAMKLKNKGSVTVQVVVRCRPLNKKELGEDRKPIITIDENQVSIVKGIGAISASRTVPSFDATRLHLTMTWVVSFSIHVTHRSRARWPSILA